MRNYFFRICCRNVWVGLKVAQFGRSSLTGTAALYLYIGSWWCRKGWSQSGDSRILQRNTGDKLKRAASLLSICWYIVVQSSAASASSSSTTTVKRLSCAFCLLVCYESYSCPSMGIPELPSTICSFWVKVWIGYIYSFQEKITLMYVPRNCLEKSFVIYTLTEDNTLLLLL